VKDVKDKKLLALMILGVLAVVSLLYGILSPSKSKRGLSSQFGTGLGAKPVPKNLLPQGRHAPRSSYESWGRNPFTLQEGISDKMLVLNGIAWDELDPKAIINDRILSVGDKIRGCTLIAVEPNRVTLNDGTQNFELKLGRKK